MKSIDEKWVQLKKEKNIPQTEQFSFEGGIKYVHFIARQIDHYAELIVQDNQLIVGIKDGYPPKGEKK